MVTERKEGCWWRKRKAYERGERGVVEETPHIMFLNLVYFSQQINRQNQRISAQGDTQLQLMEIRSKARGGSRGKETNKEEKKKRWRRMMTRRLPVWCSNFWNYLSLKVVSYEECKRKFLNLIIFLNNRQNQRISNGWWHSALLKLPLRTLSLLSTRHNTIHGSSQSH